MKAVFSMLILCGSLFAEPMYITFPSDVPWITRQSNHFEIIYRRGYDQFAERALKNAEKAHSILSPLFPPGPELTYIVLADFNDSTNGYSVDLPYPHIVIFAAPPGPGGTLAALDDWLFSVILHEYVHTLHLFPSKGLWSLLRAIFGPVILPVGLLPTHLHEGLATFYETGFTSRGRGRGSEFPMYRRMAVEEKKWGNDFVPLDLMDGSGTRWPGGTSAYFFGYYLYEDLFRRKGTKGIYDLVDEYSNNWPYFVNTPLQKVYGLDYKAAWKEIYSRTEKEAEHEIADIKKSGLSPIEFLTESRFSKWDLVGSLEADQVVFRSSNPKEGANLNVYSVKEKKVIRRHDLGASRTEGLCWGARAGKNWVLSIESSTKNFYSTNRLQAWQPESDDTAILSSDREEWTTLNHLHLLGCSPDLTHLIAYREVGGDGTIIDFSVSENEKKSLNPKVESHRYWKLPEGSRATGLQGGKDIWFVLRTGSESHLYRWPAKSPPLLLLTTRAQIFNLRLSPTDGQLYFIADFNGRNEIARWDPKKATLQKVATLLSGISSFDFNDSNFLATVYRHGGYDLAKVWRLSEPRIVTNYKYTPAKLKTKPAVYNYRSRTKGAFSEAKKAPMPAPEEPALEMSSPRRYTAWSTLLPRTWIPSLLFVPDGLQVGFWVPGFDLSQCHYYDIIGGYDIRKPASQPFGGINYRYRFLEASQLLVNLFYLPNYVYIATGSAFQKVWGGSVGLSSTIGSLPLRWTLSVIDQKIEAFGTNPANQSVGVGVGLAYDVGYSSKPLGVSPRRGTTLSVSHQQFLKKVGSSDNYYRVTAEAKQHFSAPWYDDHIWFLSVRGGLTQGTSFFNSYFQGGGEIIFSQARTFFQNRGFPYGIFLTREIINASLEYRFPLARIERGWDLKPAFFKTLQGRFVLDSTSPRPVGKVFYTSVGMEVLSDWTISYYLPAQVRVGVYHGFGPYGDPLRVVLGFEASL